MITQKDPMSALLIRNVPRSVMRRLSLRARLNGRSREAELRAILANVMAAEPLGQDDEDAPLRGTQAPRKEPPALATSDGQ
jgi:plasmid stability protein